MAPREEVTTPAGADTQSDAPDNRARLFGMSLIIFSSVMISFGGLISRNIEDADAWQLNIYRGASTLLVTGLVLIFRYRTRVIPKIRQIGRAGFVGACFLTVAGVAFMQSITSTTIANSLFTLSAIPFITAALAWIFLREPLKRITVITMVVAAAGIGVMQMEGLGGGSLYGNAMALLTAIGFSTYAVIIRRNRNVDMLPALVTSSLMLCTIALAMRIGDWSISWWDILMCFIWGGVLSGAGSVMFVAASRLLVAAELTFFMLLEFALGPIWVWLFVNEVPSQWGLIGGALIMGAVLVRTLVQVRDAQKVAKRGRLAGPI